MEDIPLKHKVLLIEDDDQLAQLVREILDSDKFLVHGVRRGNVALDALRGIEFGTLDRSVNSNISPLRRRFAEATSAPRKIKTIWDAATYSARSRGRSQCFVR